ncbi:MAG: serine/threonine protein kinase [Phycisphaerales bacterium]|nr:serine/threonine protein kinase [Phycisphaerales bacterium]
MAEQHRVATIGDVLNTRYTVVDVIGQGGQAVVFAATDPNNNTVVVKQLLSDPSDKDHALQVARFERVAGIRIPHPQVVNPIDSFRDLGYFQVFDRIDGKELGQLSTPIPWKEAIRLVRSIAGTLVSIHQHGVVHRDLKPSNILVDQAGTPHLIDFGIARVAGTDTLTPTNAVVGSLMHVAPEQLRGCGVDGRADLCSLGLILFELLTGHPPRAGGDDALKQQAMHETPPPPSSLVTGIPSGLDEIVARLCALDPDDRYPDARAVLDAIDHLSNGAAPSGTRCLACGARAAHSQTECGGCQRLFPRDHFRLERTKPRGGTRQYLIPEGSFVVGREQFAPEDLLVSRKQFAIGSGRSLAIRDAHARNPTRIDGVVPSTTTPARCGQRIACANHEFVITRHSPTH